MLDSTFACFREIAVDKVPFLHLPPIFPLKRLIPTGFSPIQHITRLEVPKLFIHGTGDGIVPHSMGRRLFEAAPEAKSFFSVERGSHLSFFQDRRGPAWDEFICRFRQIVGI